jgi:large subunit ribosomal protein L32
MAVPKRKTTPSRQGMRRSHLALSKANPILDKDTGEYRLPHHIDTSSGKYNNREIIIKKPQEDEE